MDLINEVARKVDFKVTDEAKDRIKNEIFETLDWIDLENKIIKMLYQYSGHED